MEDMKTILDRVLAGVGEMVAERKGSIRAAECASAASQGGADAGGRSAGGSAVRFKVPTETSTTDDTDPAGRGCGPKTSGGRTDRNL